MATPSTAAFLEALRQYQLLEPDQQEELAKIQGRFSDVKGLARELIQRGLLTAYQANQLLVGKGHELVLGSYVLLERIGEGGMGAVFKAFHQKLGRVVALKVIRKERLSNPQAVRRFHREIRAAAQLNHPNIVLAFDADEHKGTHFFAMEYVSGIDLSQLVKSQGPLPIDMASEFLRQAAQGLQHAYACGLIHRDIKPSNLLVSYSTASQRGGDSGKGLGTTPTSVTLKSTVKLLDLGLARLESDGDESGSQITQEGAVMGTPDYLAPEQAIDSHQADIRADLYSLGCTFYYVLTGRVPFPGGTMTEKLLKHQMQQPTPVEQLRPEVPPPVAAVLRKLMAKKPADRFQTPAEVSLALEAGEQGGRGAGERGSPRVEAAPVLPKSSPAAPRPASIEPVAATPPAAHDPFGSMMGDTEVSVRSPQRRAKRVAPKKGLPKSVLIGGAAALVGLVALIIFLAVGSGPGNKAGEPNKDRTEGKFKVAVAADRPWQDTGIDVEANRPVTVSAGGHWGRRGQQLCSAAGLPDLGRDRVVLPSAPAFSLVGRIGNSARPIPLGHPTPLQPPQSGRLFVQINDLDLDANTGSLEIEITGSVRKGNPQPAPEPSLVERAEAELKPLAARVGEPARPELLAFLRKYPGTYQATRAADLLAQLPAPADKLAFLPEAERQPGQPAELVAVLGGTAWRHGNQVPAVAVSPDGALIASGGGDRLVILWDPATGKRKATLTGHVNTVRSVAFSADGKTLASGDDSGNVKTWDVATGKNLTTFRAHASMVRGLAFAPDGKTLATGGHDVEASLKLWNLQNQTTIYARQADSEQLVSIALAPNGKTLATGGRDGLKLWDFATGQLQATMTGHTSYVHGVAFSPDGLTLASAGYSDRTVRLWDVAAAKEKAVLQGHTNNVYSVAFAPDGKTLASAGDGTLRLWDIATAKELVALKGHLAHVYMVAFLPDGRTLVSGGGEGGVRLWDTGVLRQRSVLEGHAGWVHGVAISPDGQTLVSTDANDSSVRVWDLTGKKEPVSRVAHVGGVYSVAFAPDGKTFATASGDATVKIWETATAQVVATWTGHTAGVLIVAFSSDGKYLASGGNDHTVRLWEVATGKTVQTLAEPSDNVYGLAFAPDGQTLASAGSDRNVHLWDVATGKERAIFRGHRDLITLIAFSPDGKTLATGSWDRTVRLWDPATGQVRANLRQQPTGIGSIAYAPDGKSLAVGTNDAKVRLWNLAAQTSQTTPPLHSGMIRALAFTPDGKTLASVGQDRTVRLWDVPPARDWPPVAGPQSQIRSVALTPDGATLAAGDQEGTIWLYDLAARRLRSALPGNTGPVTALTYLGDGKTLAAGMEGGDVTVRLWDTTTGLEVATFGQEGTYGLTGSADGKTLAVACPSAAHILETTRLDDHTPLSRVQGKSVPFLALSPSGDTVASGAEDRSTVEFWDTRSGQLLAPLEGLGLFTAAAYAPDRRTLATGQNNGLLQFWDPDTGKQQSLVQRPEGILSLSWAPNGKTLAFQEAAQAFTVLHTIKPDDAKKWQLPGLVYQVALAPDGRHLAVANCDGTVYYLRVGAVPDPATSTPR